ncbi:hypothetical protein EX30DRAFT_257621 [Ascodesmis nigricans]|uniref:Uncharacterized protein n=1 Tax=Ascodesmis nigricans TaxID=341454 RepID=A0A4S2MHG4_9PEZI|nr:hypothetical protein EX30DRAFT_257621 [Ascodesmis nigricans]
MKKPRLALSTLTSPRRRALPCSINIKRDSPPTRLSSRSLAPRDDRVYNFLKLQVDYMPEAPCSSEIVVVPVWIGLSTETQKVVLLSQGVWCRQSSTPHQTPRMGSSITISPYQQRFHRFRITHMPNALFFQVGLMIFRIQALEHNSSMARGVALMMMMSMN